MTITPPIHLWVFNHPFHGISDQVDFFMSIMEQHGYKVTIGKNPRQDALNTVIENFSYKTSGILLDFCAKTSKRVAVIMTEHVDFLEQQITIHGFPLWNKNDYMHPATQISRLKNLMSCIQYVRCFLVLGDLPELRNFSKMLPGIPIRNLPFPRIDKKKALMFQKDQVKFDAVFTGFMTQYRHEILANLQRKVSVTYPQKTLNHRARDALNRSSKIILNIPQRASWNWLSLMRIIAGLKCGRATISLGTKDCSEISSCCIQLNLTDEKGMDLLKKYIAEYKTAFHHAIEQYGEMAATFEKRYGFPHDMFEIWQIVETRAI
jgi:hypothetical protein